MKRRSWSCPSLASRLCRCLHCPAAAAEAAPAIFWGDLGCLFLAGCWRHEAECSGFECGAFWGRTFSAAFFGAAPFGAATFSVALFGAALFKAAPFGAAPFRTAPLGLCFQCMDLHLSLGLLEHLLMQHLSCGAASLECGPKRCCPF